MSENQVHNDIDEVLKMWGIECRINFNPTSPVIYEDGRQRRKVGVTFLRKENTTADDWYFYVPYYVGIGWQTAPHVADVLNSLILDYSVADYDSFEAWAADYGYDTDSRKAEKFYRACLQQSKAFRLFFTSAQRAALAEMLQDY